MSIDEDVFNMRRCECVYYLILLCSIILNFGLSTDIVGLFLGRAVLTWRGIFGLCDGRYLRTFLSLNPGRCL
jgi:hypothetical protein